MTRTIARPRRLLPSAIGAFATAAAVAIGGPALAGAAHCSAPEYRQFDFWLGNWKAYDDDGKGPYIARTRSPPFSVVASCWSDIGRTTATTATE